MTPASLTIFLIHKNRGSALMVVFLLSIVFVGIGTALTISSIHKKRVAAKYQDNMIAHLDANCMLDKMINELSLDLTTSGDWSDGDINGTAWGPSTGSYSVFSSGVSCFIGGTYAVSFQNIAGSTNSAWVKSSVTRNGITRTIEVLLESPEGISIWNYGILGGAGSAGTNINGNVNVMGSVTILGTGLASTDYAMNLGGAATLMSNNYGSVGAAVIAQLTGPADTVIFNGESVETLHGELRVKNGIVSLNGSAEIGQPDIFGNSWKETVDGVYTNHGFGGSMGTANVHSDNGTSNVWDLGNNLEFPDLPDPYQGYSDYKAYLVGEKNMYVTSPAEDAILSNIGPTSVFSIGDANGSISMNGSGQMTINGYIYAGASGTAVTFRDVGANKTIQYTGKGVLFANSDVNINITTMVPSMPGAPGADFPENNVLGVVAANNINVTSPGIIAGAFYARNAANIFLQTKLVGSLVSNYIFVANVPDIIQVLDFQPHLPDGLIDNQAAGSGGLSITVWRES